MPLVWHTICQALLAVCLLTKSLWHCTCFCSAVEVWAAQQMAERLPSKCSPGSVYGGDSGDCFMWWRREAGSLPNFAGETSQPGSSLVHLYLEFPVLCLLLIIMPRMVWTGGYTANNQGNLTWTFRGKGSTEQNPSRLKHNWKLLTELKLTPFYLSILRFNSSSTKLF